MLTLEVGNFCIMWLIHILRIWFADKSIIFSVAKLPGPLHYIN